MPTLTLQCDNRVLTSCIVGQAATIGRLPGNTLVIDNPSVSGHHARVFRDGDAFVVEDLGSTNGTFVNGKHVSRHPLESGDAVRIGKHTIVFDAIGGGEAAEQQAIEAVMSNPGDTMYLDAHKHKALVAWLQKTQSAAEAEATEAARRLGVLRVLKGRADKPEYTLEAHTSLVGKSDAALVRLKGFFKPKEAVAIARNGEGYVATAIGGTTQVNNQRLRGRHPLADGDILEVGGLTLEFRFVA